MVLTKGLLFMLAWCTMHDRQESTVFWEMDVRRRYTGGDNAASVSIVADDCSSEKVLRAGSVRDRGESKWFYHAAAFQRKCPYTDTKRLVHYFYYDSMRSTKPESPTCSLILMRSRHRWSSGGFVEQPRERNCPIFMKIKGGHPKLTMCAADR